MSGHPTCADKLGNDGRSLTMARTSAVDGRKPGERQPMGPFQKEAFQNSEFEPKFRVDKHEFTVDLMNSESESRWCTEI